MEKPSHSYAVPAVENMLNIVELLAHSKTGCSLNELSRRTGASLNSTYRICLLLEDRGYLCKQANGQYRLDSGFYYLGKAAGQGMQLRRCARPVMESLCRETDETVHLTVLRGQKMVLLDQCETAQPIRVQVEPGLLLEPVGSAFGKCLLAFGDPEMQNDYLARPIPTLTEHTLTDPAVIRAELAAVRQQGVAYDHEEYMEGLLCVGAPVFGKDGTCVASLGVIVPKYRAGDAVLQTLTTAVKAAAAELTKRMGGAADDDRDSV